MTNAATQLTVPAHIQARIAARQQAPAASSITSTVVSGDGFSFPKISIKASRYRLVEDGVETPVGINLDVIIVGANPRVSKIFYAKPYDGSAENVRPDCFSNDGLKPDGSVQAPVSDSCLTCPHNVLGSKITPTGAQSKMCGDQRHLAVVPAADPNKIYALSIAVSSMKNLREYFKELQNFGVDANEVVTELGFDDKVSYPKLTFKRKGYVPAKALPRVDELSGSDTVKEVVRMIPPTSKPAALAAPATAAAALSAPAVEEGYEEATADSVGVSEVAAPAPTPAAAKPAKPAKPTVEAVKGSSALESKLDSLFAE